MEILQLSYCFQIFRKQILNHDGRHQTADFYANCHFSRIQLKKQKILVENSITKYYRRLTHFFHVQFLLSKNFLKMRKNPKSREIFEESRV